MEFWAPDAKILVVDDNKMSLTLARNLISAFGIQVDCAESGEKALGMLGNCRYHLIFMDYMMPGMDGVETTRLIRKSEDAYNREVPIIALTGDDMPDEELFRTAGMNDYLPKPLRNPLLGIILYKWLPRDLIIIKEDKKHIVSEENMQSRAELWLDLPGIDVEEGVRNSGNKDALQKFLRDFYLLIDVKAALLENYLSEKLIQEYTIEVHALKNSARIIGAMELSGQFQKMEQLGKAGDWKALEEQTPALLSMYRGLKPILEPFGVTEAAGKKEVSAETIIGCLKGLQEAIEAFDLDSADMAMEQLEEYKIPQECQGLMVKLKAAVADVAMEHILVMSEEMISFLQQ